MFVFESLLKTYSIVHSNMLFFLYKMFCKKPRSHLKENKYCIAIMSIGSGVGQSVITSCNLSSLPIRTIGLGMNPMAFGVYECDLMDDVPLIYDPQYIPTLIKKCQEHHVDIIILGFDDEAMILAQNKESLEALGFKVLVLEPEFIRLIRDKAKMCEELSKFADIIVKSYDLRDITELLQWGPLVFLLLQNLGMDLPLRISRSFLMSMISFE